MHALTVVATTAPLRSTPFETEPFLRRFKPYINPYNDVIPTRILEDPVSGA